MTPSRRALAAVAAGVLLFAACGDDDEDSALFDDTDETTDGTTDDGDQTTDDTTDDGDQTTEVGDFCDLVGELESLEELEESFTDPDAVESQISEIRDLYAQGAELAPDEIADDFDMVHESLTAMADAFADADYNLLDVQVSALRDLEDPELEAATDSLEEYGERECGIDSSGDDEEGNEDNAFDDIVDDLPEDATLRDGIVQQFTNQGIEEEAAQCIGDRLEPADFEDEAAFTDHLQSCGIDPSTGEPTGETTG